MSTVKENFEWFLENQGELLEEYSGRYLVIEQCSVKAAFGSEIEALQHAGSHFEPGTYIVQYCTPGDSAYSTTYFSRVAI